jgi:hypothetical protein
MDRQVSLMCRARYYRLRGKFYQHILHATQKRRLRITQMNTSDGSSRGDVSPEKIRIAMRRAHMERAKAMRELVARLFGRRRGTEKQGHAAGAALSATGSRC